MGDPLRDARHGYRDRRLLESDLASDPIVQFRRWFDEAGSGGVAEPNAAAFASSGDDRRVRARMVLLRGVDASGFTFFSNYESAKARDIADNPHGALLFYWPHVERQVRVEGTIARTPDRESDEYFASRPRGHQVAAWASSQSRPLASREELERRCTEVAERFEGGDIPRPPHWGGYRLTPERVEFWQGGPDRLHDRLVFRRAGGQWVVERLSP